MSRENLIKIRVMKSDALSDIKLLSKMKISVKNEMEILEDSLIDIERKERILNAQYQKLCEQELEISDENLGSINT